MENQYKRVPEEQMGKSWRAILAKNIQAEELSP
jgi:hypothetical protein